MRDRSLWCSMVAHVRMDMAPQKASSDTDSEWEDTSHRGGAREGLGGL